LIRLHPFISSPLLTQPIILTMPARTMARLEMIIDTQNRMLESITKERDNAITARDNAKQDLYIPTRTRGLYITADPPTPTPNTLTEVLHDLPNDELELIWSSNWRSTHPEKYQNSKKEAVNMHGRLGTRVPGIFVAHEEVERPMRIWYATEGGMAVVKMHNLDLERDGIWEVYKRWSGM